MNIYDYNEDWYSGSESSNIANSGTYNARISGFISQVYSYNTLQLFAAVCQVLLGMTVITVSILGFIQPLWMSTFLSMIASIVTMVGVYIIYAMLSRKLDPDLLLRNAMRRVMEAKN